MTELYSIANEVKWCENHSIIYFHLNSRINEARLNSVMMRSKWNFNLTLNWLQIALSGIRFTWHIWHSTIYLIQQNNTIHFLQTLLKCNHRGDHKYYYGRWNCITKHFVNELSLFVVYVSLLQIFVLHCLKYKIVPGAITSFSMNKYTFELLAWLCSF